MYFLSSVSLLKASDDYEAASEGRRFASIQLLGSLIWAIRNHIS